MYTNKDIQQENIIIHDMFPSSYHGPASIGSCGSILATFALFGVSCTKTPTATEEKKTPTAISFRTIPRKLSCPLKLSMLKKDQVFTWSQNPTKGSKQLLSVSFLVLICFFSFLFMDVNCLEQTAFQSTNEI